jgi:hypothetical protein
MIDTIIISIPKDKVTNVLYPNQTALGWHQQATGATYSKFVRNPSKQDLESGLYFPRLTGINRKVDGKIDASIKVEFSVPKLLFKNNLDELEEKDFDEVISTLKDRLLRMGIAVPEKYLIHAPVSAVHFSKNIQLTDGFTSQYVLSELSKIDIRKSFDFSKTRFMNDGQSIYAYTISHSFVIYDKIADLKKDEKRAMDKDQTQYQRSLFDEIEKKDLYEVIRFEVRLSQKKKVNSLFKKLGIKEHPTFHDVFKKSLSQKIVQHYWQTLIGSNSMLLFSLTSGPKDVLRQILTANPKLKPKQALYFTSLVTMTKDGSGLRELRSIVGKYADQRSWYRMKDDIKVVTELLRKVRPRDWYDQIEKGLKEYKSFKNNSP